MIERAPTTKASGSSSRLLWPFLGAFIVFGPLYPTVRIELLSRINIPSSLIGSWVDVITFFILIIIIWRGHKGTNIPSTSRIIFYIIIAAGVSTLLTNGVPEIIFGIRQTYWPMIFFFAGTSLIEDWFQVSRLWKILIGAFAALALSGVILTYLVPEYWTSLYLSDAGNTRGWGLDAIAREGALRMTGTILDPVVFGIVCGWGLVLSFSAYCVSRNFKHCLFYGLAFLVCLIGVTFSLSRGAWIGSFLSLLACLLINPKWMLLKRLIGPSLLAVYCALIASMLYGGADLGQNFDSLGNTIEKTVSEGNWQRQAQFDGVLNNLTERPLGNGVGMAGHVGASLSLNGMTEDGYPHITDGWYLKLLAEGGFPLFVAFIAYLLFLTGATTKAAVLTRDRRQKAFLAALLGIQVAALAQALVSNIWDLYYLSQMLWLIGGVSTACFARSLKFRSEVA